MRFAIVLLAATATVAGVAAGCASDTDTDVDAAVAPADTTGLAVPDSLCADPSQPNQPCSTIPHDVAVTLGEGYEGLVVSDQIRIDVFSWQSFVALNWPADANGQPLDVPLDSATTAPRVWESYVDAAVLFHGNDVAGSCGATAATRGRRLFLQMAKNGQVVDPGGDFDEATGSPLIDRNGNFVVFQKKVNPVEQRYIDSLSLTDPAVQDTFTTISFPFGYYENDTTRTGGDVGSIEMKAAWRVMTTADDTTRFYTRPASIFVPAANSATGAARCIDATVGLIGLHIVHKTAKFDRWVWSSFEHVDNAPTCAAGAATCGDTARTYSLYDANCTTCSPNQAPSAGSDSTFLWADSLPYASRYLIDGRHGSQIVRTVPVADYTERVNRFWRSRLGSTVWSNYRLLGSQWQVPGDIPTEPPITTVDSLANTSMESFIPTSGCLGCHAFATTTNDSTPADFSFLLRMARADTTLRMLPRNDGDGTRIGH